MINICVMHTGHNDGCGWYRCYGPFSHLAKNYKDDVRVFYNNNPHWAEVKGSDILFMQRPAASEWKAPAFLAKDFGVPIWVDYDDDLFSVPFDNPAKAAYPPYMLANIHEFLTIADLVTVSTEHLRQQFLKFNKNVVVVPNALDRMLLKFVNPKPTEKLVLWRGTTTHASDVGYVAEQIVKASEKFPGYKFCFLGADPAAWACSSKIKGVIRITNALEPFLFYKSIMNLKPEILIAPLFPDLFNNSKSNIAAIEGMLGGAATLGPDFEEWRAPGITNYSDPADFGVKLNAMLSKEINPAEQFKKTYEFIMQKRTLEVTNQLRFNLMNGLVK